eukprot:SM000198S05322  [mRNA]  locus=s198:232631:235134:+ [translate_table: standard]
MDERDVRCRWAGGAREGPGANVVRGWQGPVPRGPAAPPAWRAVNPYSRLPMPWGGMGPAVGVGHIPGLAAVEATSMDMTTFPGSQGTYSASSSSHLSALSLLPPDLPP